MVEYKDVQFSGAIPQQPQIKYDIYDRDAPYYEYQTLSPQENYGSGLVIPRFAGGQFLTFKLDNNVVNLSHSYFEFDINVSAPTAAARAPILHALGTTMIRNIRVFSQSGNLTVDLLNCNEFNNAVLPIVTPIDEMKSNGDALNAFSGIHQNGSVRAVNAANNAIITVAQQTLRPADNSAYSAQDEIKYSQPLLDAVGANASVARVRIPMKSFPHSILSKDQDIPTGSLYIRFYIEGYDKFLYSSTAVDGGNTGAATFITAGSIQITNPLMYIASEKNEIIRSAILAKYLSGGIRMNIDHVERYEETRSGTSQNVNIQIDKNMGKKLKRVYWCPYPSNATLATAFDHQNWADAAADQKINTYNTYLDSNLEQQAIVDTRRNQDYEINKLHFKGGCIFNVDIYKYNWIHIAAYDDMHKLGKGQSCGIPLAQGMDHTWGFRASTANATLNHKIWVVVEREVLLSPSGNVWL